MQDVPRSKQFDDVYFSVQGGLDETRHVFMAGNGLPDRWQEKKRFTICETGFGTGLNFLEAWRSFEETAPPDAVLDYISFEKYPLTAEEIETYLSSWRDVFGVRLPLLCAHYPLRVNGFHRIVLNERIILTLIFDDVNKALPQLEAQVDAWFLDGFTPAKNPDMWSETLFLNMQRLSAPEATVATFTAAGVVKRGLESAGFAVEKVKGFGHKRDMLTGRFGLEKECPKPVVTQTGKRVAIIGGGLAGAACAYVMQGYGFDPVLYEASDTLAPGASGNTLGLINPRFTAFREAEAEFYSAAYAQAIRTLSRFNDVDYTACGTLHLITDAQKEKRLHRTVQNWGWHPDHMRLLSAQEASDVAGAPLHHDALFLPDAPQLSPQKLCLAMTRNIQVAYGQRVQDLDHLNADIVILACGIGVRDFFDLPLHTVRGQVTKAAQTPESATLKTNICYGGYIAAAQSGEHVVGATFQRWLDHTDVVEQDNLDNLKNLHEAVPSLSSLSVPSGARAALRCSSHDRFPVIGHLRDHIYVSTAHGSHGIISALAGAHLLVDMMRGGPVSLAMDAVKKLDPARFGL